MGRAPGAARARRGGEIHAPAGGCDTQPADRGACAWPATTPTPTPSSCGGLIGVVAHQTYLYDELTALENLRFYGALYDVPDVTERATVLLDAVGLASKRDARAGTSRVGSSSGSRSPARSARSANSILDEPDTGLDLAAFALLERLPLAANARFD